MKRIFPCLLITLMLTGCFADVSDTTSAIEYSRQGDNEMRHYRPIHRTQREWSIAESAKTLTVKAGKDHLRLSVRTPDRIVVRKGGIIVGNVVKTEDGAQYVPINSESPASSISCRSTHQIQISDNKRQISWTFDDEGNASSGNLFLKTIGHHRFSVAQKTSQNDSAQTCEGVEIESPFSAIGTLVFQEEKWDLAELAGYAWFLTKIDSICLK